MLGDARVVSGYEPVRTGLLRELQQPPEAERAVAADARIRRFAAFVRAHERIDDRLAKLFAKVERHVRHPERVTRLACGDHGLGRAASSLGVWAVGVEPEPERDADRSRQRPQQRDRTVHPAAHRHSNAPRRMRRPENGSNRIRECVNGQSVPTNGGSVEQRKPDQ